MIAQLIFFVSLCVRGIVVKCGESLSFISTGNYKKLILSEIKEVFLLVCTVRSSHQIALTTSNKNSAWISRYFCRNYQEPKARMLIHETNIVCNKYCFDISKAKRSWLTPKQKTCMKALEIRTLKRKTIVSTFNPCPWGVGGLAIQCTMYIVLQWGKSGQDQRVTQTK